MSSRESICRSCGASLAPGQRFCRQCGTQATQQEVDREASTAVFAAPPMRAPTPPFPPPQHGPRRGGTVAAVVAAAVLLALALGVGAYALTQADGGTGAPPGDQEVRGETPSEAPPRSADDAGEAAVPAGGGGDAPFPAREAVTTTAVPPGDAEEPRSSTARTSADSTNSPTGVMRRHWAAIDDGDYERAYSHFASSYTARVTGAGWIEQQESYSPSVRMLETSFEKIAGSGRAYVYVDLVTRDSGSTSDAVSSACTRFSGRVVVLRESGDWRYWGNGPGHTFTSRGTVPSSDSRCAPLFD